MRQISLDHCLQSPSGGKRLQIEIASSNPGRRPPDAALVAASAAAMIACGGVSDFCGVLTSLTRCHDADLSTRLLARCDDCYRRFKGTTVDIVVRFMRISSISDYKSLSIGYQ
uniref:Auxin_canalis domain-containing protein n=1 Tax=Angiostrongylus cantonensis TaxID=6313 RepID=A0A0K0CUF6_ANGCA